VSRVPALRSLWLADLVSVIEEGRAGAEKQPGCLRKEQSVVGPQQLIDCEQIASTLRLQEGAWACFWPRKVALAEFKANPLTND
jgi:hypothetical protein